MTKQEMKKLKGGDLIYLPSAVTLYKFNKENPCVHQATTTLKPVTTAFVNRYNNLCGVLYNGEIWSVNSQNIFLVGEQHD